jgi:hypothetical protein
MARLLVVLVLALSACATRAPRWDAYSDADPLPVRGMRATAPGPRILRALENDPATRRLIAANGEPDSLQVVTARDGRQRIVLTYRSTGGRPRRFEVDPPRRTENATASATTRAENATASAPTRRVATRRTTPAPPNQAPQAVSPAAPSARQSLECPIDPDRPDCRALCDRGGNHEWCR